MMNQRKIRSLVNLARTQGVVIFGRDYLQLDQPPSRYLVPFEIKTYHPATATDTLSHAIERFVQQSPMAVGTFTLACTELWDVASVTPCEHYTDAFLLAVERFCVSFWDAWKGVSILVDDEETGADLDTALDIL